ncbi:hypothetical protein [Saccharopolyspora gloriosae]|uniref:hypothetical protein n=1 Tax=Saccharopolyspora gloriosae TaxID=455344 RepID=UPI001FB813CE|nr:hypothetical protein [Saccharopolyspora gloriosae]
MSRVFDQPPPVDAREVCQACLAATSTEPGTVRFPVLEEALVVMSEHRSFRATAPPGPDPPIKWPETDPDALGVRANSRTRPMWTGLHAARASIAQVA